MENRTFIYIGIFLLMSTYLSAQLHFSADRYSTNTTDGWISCTESTNPNPARGTGHWISYDLGLPYFLGTSHFWNVNDPDNLDAGVKLLAVDYSDNGTNWTELAVFPMPKSDGSLFYEGVIGPNFLDKKVRHILFTVVENYGAACAGFGEIKIDVVNPLLPLTLLDFFVECNSLQGIDVKWETEDEINVKEFAIERSVDSKEWEQIALVKSLSEDNRNNKYSYIDQSSFEYYYRLKMIDIDGLFSYSEIRKPNCIILENEIMVQPNPIVNRAMVELNTTGVSNFEFQLFNNLGQLLQSKVFDVKNDKSSFEINTSGLSAGEYFINVIIGKEMLNKKIIVL